MLIKIKNYVRLLIWKCRLTKIQLQKKFKHASDFGIIGNYSDINAEAFRKAIINHFLDKNTILIAGSYRGIPVNHYYNRLTKINVICKNKKFLSCWELSAIQQFHIISRGSL